VLPCSAYFCDIHRACRFNHCNNDNIIWCVIITNRTSEYYLANIIIIMTQVYLLLGNVGDVPSAIIFCTSPTDEKT
jgi:hypothetical protein